MRKREWNILLRRLAKLDPKDITVGEDFTRPERPMYSDLIGEVVYRPSGSFLHRLILEFPPTLKVKPLMPKPPKGYFNAPFGFKVVECPVCKSRLNQQGDAWVCPKCNSLGTTIAVKEE